MGAVSANLRVLMMFLVLSGIFVAIGWAVGAIFFNDWVAGALIFLVIAAAMNIVSYFFSSKIVLASYRAKVVSEADAPRLYRIVRNISQTAGLPMPQVAIVPTQTPNAFATGRNPKHATVAATEGILNLLNDDELTGVLAHEMAHVKDRDILVMSVAATLAGAISYASRSFFWGSMFGGGNRDNGNILIAVIVAITAPIAALMLQMAVSRSREYLADREGAEMIGKPLYLASALRKLEAGNRARPMQFGSPTSSGMWIVNPFKGGGLVNLFSTHPPMDERIRRLENMASGIRM
ncbi:zinc metalloprotease HtpX [Methanomassiliicoccus luminyensis]|uniref:zinc metalloprotease HtpX n=2 Tax=Methanomassiliicoccus luminyensis TaxID=1080712 RepID=UPI0006741629|nr:zinc metalloprotease HtpX [Methanomassiliicoccus luminyensis]